MPDEITVVIIVVDFRMEFLRALPEIGSSLSRGMFINSCYIHCQSEMQETWHGAHSPVLDSTVSFNDFLSFVQFLYRLQVFMFSSNSRKSFGVQSIAEAVGGWFYDRNPFEKIDCPYPCDSSCPIYVKSEA